MINITENVEVTVNTNETVSTVTFPNTPFKCIPVTHHVDVKYIVLDLEGSLLGYSFKPIKVDDYYHPQPGTEWLNLGMLATLDTQVASLTHPILITL